MIVGVCMVKDEADIIGTVIRHLFAEGVDHILVADNLSSDGTSEILFDLRDELPLTVLRDGEVGFYQSRKMSELALRAHDLGADWVLPFDADEVWYSPTHDSIAEALAAQPEDVTVVRAPGWDHIARDDGSVQFEGRIVQGGISQMEPLPDALQVFSPYRRERTQQMVKVAFRAHPDAKLHMGNHDVERPGNQTHPMPPPLAFRHFQYRSLEQMTRKLRNGRAAYEASDIHPMHGTHWRSGGLKPDEELAAEWAELCSEEGLVFDPAPLRVPVS